MRKSQHIDEKLIGYNSESKNQTLQTYLQSLVDKHKLKVHNGQFAIVLNPPDLNYIYKLWTVDAGFDKWIEVCKTHQNNPAIPKIIGRIKTIPNFFIRRSEFTLPIKIVKIEKLKPLASKYAPYLEIIYKAHRGNASKEKAIQLLKAEYAPPAAITFCDRIYKIVEDNVDDATIGFDLGVLNVMVRDSDWVLTDGFSDVGRINVSDGQITRQMDDYNFLPKFMAPTVRGGFIQGRGNTLSPVNDNDHRLPHNKIMYWLTQDAYREFNYQEFNKLKDTNKVFEVWKRNKMFPTLNLVAYAFLKRHIDFLEYTKAVTKSSIISAYVLALTYQPSMPLDITKVMDIDNDAMSDILFSITQVEIPLARIAEVIDILYGEYPTEVIQVISEEYMESKMFKYILQHLVANNDDARLEQLLDRMVEID
jgi:hypothetical protein